MIARKPRRSKDLWTGQPFRVTVTGLNKQLLLLPHTAANRSRRMRQATKQLCVDSPEIPLLEPPSRHIARLDEQGGSQFDDEPK